MNLLVLFLFVGLDLVSAVPVPSHDLSVQADDLEHLLNFAFQADDDDDVRTEIGKKLREKLNEILEKLRDATEREEQLKEDIVQKLKELRQNLKENGVNLGEMAKELLRILKEKAREWLDKLLEKLKQKRSVDVRDLLRQLRKKIEENFDSDEIKYLILEIFGGGSDISAALIRELKDKSEETKSKFLEFIDRFLEYRKERSIKEIYENIKKYFKELQIELKEKFTKFGIWAKGKYEKGLEKGKDKAANLKKLAKEFIHDAKVIGKDVAEQAKDFFQEYKDDLGTIYDDVREKVREILSRKE